MSFNRRQPGGWRLSWSRSLSQQRRDAFMPATKRRQRPDAALAPRPRRLYILRHVDGQKCLGRRPRSRGAPAADRRDHRADDGRALRGLTPWRPGPRGAAVGSTLGAFDRKVQGRPPGRPQDGAGVRETGAVHGKAAAQGLSFPGGRRLVEMPALVSGSRASSRHSVGAGV